MGVESYENVVALLKFMEKGLAGALTGFELMWQRTYRAMTQPPSSFSALTRSLSLLCVYRIVGK